MIPSDSYERLVLEVERDLKLLYIILDRLKANNKILLEDFYKEK